MAFFPSSFTLTSVAVIFSLLGIRVSALSLNYYASSCPQANIIIKSAVISAILNERRMGASLLRLHFHDCFVDGCDASVLLDDDPTTGFIGEKTAIPNRNSIRGFEVIDEIKAKIEAKCRVIVSCADILAVAARDSVVALGGKTYDVPLGRKDSKTANFSGANTDLPPPFGSNLLNTLITSFSRKGFTTQEMVVLSGAHTIGKAHCFLFRDRLYNDTNIDRTYAESLKKSCTRSPSDDNNLSPLDVTTENRFDNAYYANLVNNKGLLSSDQVLFNGGSTDSIVTTYKNSPLNFLLDFGKAMVKMGNLSPPRGSQGEIRANCRKRNA